jgi:hypothetical protein
MNENRGAPRRKVFYYLEIIDLDRNEPLGRLGDISPSGIMILTDTPLPRGKKYRVSILLPETGVFPKKALDMEVETRWEKPDLNPKILCTGCSLVQTAPENIKIIDALVEFYGFSEGQKNLNIPDF